MSLKNFYFWLVNSVLGLGILLQGLSSPGKISLFLILHGLSAFFSYHFFMSALIFSKKSREIIGFGFQAFLIPCLCLPIVGPSGIVMLTLVLLYLPVKASAIEEYEIIDSVWLENYTYNLEEMEFFKISPPVIIHNELTFEEAILVLKKLQDLEWFPYKTRILQLFLEYYDNPAITLEASYLINSKKDSLMKQIHHLESFRHPDSAVLANLYHEIAYLCLVGPVLEKYYREISCKYIEEAISVYPNDADIWIKAIKYHLESGKVEKAEKYLSQGIKKFHDSLNFQKILRPYLKEVQYLKGVGLEKLEREMIYDNSN